MNWLIWDSILVGVGFVGYPLLTRYLLVPVGSTVWEDLKKVAYAVKDKLTGWFKKS